METANNNSDSDSQASGPDKTIKSWEIKSQEKPDKSRLENEALKEYIEISKRYPLHKHKRKGIKPELERLAQKYPGVSFPGSHTVKTLTTEYEIQLRLHSQKLKAVIKEKLNKKFSTLSFVESAVKILERINQAEMITGRELLNNSGIGKTKLNSIIHILIGLGFVQNYQKGIYHRYGIVEEGRKFMEKIESNEN